MAPDLLGFALACFHNLASLFSLGASCRRIVSVSVLN
jgi:hypothetical protein